MRDPKSSGVAWKAKASDDSGMISGWLVGVGSKWSTGDERGFLHENAMKQRTKTKRNFNNNNNDEYCESFNDQTHWWLCEQVLSEWVVYTLFLGWYFITGTFSELATL